MNTVYWTGPTKTTGHPSRMVCVRCIVHRRQIIQSFETHTMDIHWISIGYMRRHSNQSIWSIGELWAFADDDGKSPVVIEKLPFGTAIRDCNSGTVLRDLPFELAFRTPIPEASCIRAQPQIQLRRTHLFNHQISWERMPSKTFKNFPLNFLHSCRRQEKPHRPRIRLRIFEINRISFNCRLLFLEAGNPFKSFKTASRPEAIRSYREKSSKNIVASNNQRAFYWAG